MAASAAAETAFNRHNRDSSPPIRELNFDVAKGIIAMAAVASKTDHPKWAWDGTSYTMRPTVQNLNNHSDVFKVLLQLTPNGYTCLNNLRHLLLMLHQLYGIFSGRPLGPDATTAASNWRHTCKHCVFLVSRKIRIPCACDGLKGGAGPTQTGT